LSEHKKKLISLFLPSPLLLAL